MHWLDEVSELNQDNIPAADDFLFLVRVEIAIWKQQSN